LGAGEAGDENLPLRRAVREERRVPEGADGVQGFLARDHEAEPVEGVGYGTAIVDEGEDAYGGIVDGGKVRGNLPGGICEHLGSAVCGYGKHEKFTGNSFAGSEVDLPSRARLAD
jgi:hypothetical protein